VATAGSQDGGVAFFGQPVHPAVRWLDPDEVDVATLWSGEG